MNIAETAPRPGLMGSVRIAACEMIPGTKLPVYAATIVYNEQEVRNPEVWFFTGFEEKVTYKRVPTWGKETSMTNEKKAPPELWAEVNKALDRLLAAGRVRGPLNYRQEPTWWR